ncbi:MULTISPECIES: hypothetical protein [Streptomyces]|uniref:Uncharacterized protein n=1 Tax=Streptomyces tricolor TaxID=68277 RepID=A0ABS9JI61_9ACTN|nr:hypothetical protein [Streptomyces tricolor]MCG0065257.1 hypothetical protein [Streptomyces tricolor]
MNACHGRLAGPDNGSHAVGLFTGAGFLGISTRLATTAGRPVRVTFRARASTLAGDCGLRRTRHPGKDFRCQAEGHPLATVIVTDDWRTWTYDFTPTGPDTGLRFTPGPRAGCGGPLLTDVVARETGS